MTGCCKQQPVIENSMIIKDNDGLLLAGTVESIITKKNCVVLMVDGAKAVFAGRAIHVPTRTKIMKGEQIIAKGYEGSMGDFMGNAIKKYGSFKTEGHVVIRSKVVRMNGDRIILKDKLPIDPMVYYKKGSIKEGDVITLMCELRMNLHCEKRFTCLKFSPAGCHGCRTVERDLVDIYATKI